MNSQENLDKKCRLYFGSDITLDDFCLEFFEFYRLSIPSPSSSEPVAEFESVKK